MEQQTECPIWGTPATETATSRDGRQINSPRAGGTYFITGTAAAVLTNRDDADKVKLTSWLVEQRRLGVSCPEIYSTTLDGIANRRTPAVHDRAGMVLVFLSAGSPTIGAPFAFSKRWLNEAAQSWQRDPTFLSLLAHSNSLASIEVDYLLNYLVQEGWVERTAHLPGPQSQGPHRNREDYSEYLVTPDGHARIAELTQKHSASAQAFVAMWFDSSMIDAYEKGIAPAIREAGFEPLRIDGKQHNNKIDDEIIAEIRRSRFVVADFTEGPTGARGGVYYEAGFAHGLGMPVIFTCSAATFSNVHFDTRQYNHIVWTDAEDLRRQLTHRISATIGDGPGRGAR